MGLAISRHWGQSPHWFDGLTYEMRLELVADYMLTHESHKDSQKKASEARVEAFHEQRRVFTTEGACDG